MVGQCLCLGGKFYSRSPNRNRNNKWFKACSSLYFILPWSAEPWAATGAWQMAPGQGSRQRRRFINFRKTFFKRLGVIPHRWVFEASGNQMRLCFAAYLGGLQGLKGFNLQPSFLLALARDVRAGFSSRNGI